MDDQVRSAMAKWPHVPAVYGWLRLDARGNWHLIDRGAPGFDEALHGRGSPITSPPIRDFIERNYTCNEQGQWYWQNGPQRAYVDCDRAPLVLRVMTNPAQVTEKSLMAHTGNLVTSIGSIYSDEAGHVFMSTDLGPAAVHDMDLAELEIRTTANAHENSRENSPESDAYLVWRGCQYPIIKFERSMAELLGFDPQPRA